MAAPIFPSFPFDIHNITGPTRALGPVVRSGTVVPDTPFGEVARGIYIGGTGNLSITRPDGVIQIYMAPLVGKILWVSAINVTSSNTTATDLVWVS
jgi:hypothetical protein